MRRYQWPMESDPGQQEGKVGQGGAKSSSISPHAWQMMVLLKAAMITVFMRDIYIYRDGIYRYIPCQ